MHISIFNNIVLLKRIYKKERDFSAPLVALFFIEYQSKRDVEKEQGREGWREERGERVWAQMLLFGAGSPPNPVSL